MVEERRCLKERKRKGGATANDENERSDGGPRWMMLVYCCFFLCIDRWQRRRHIYFPSFAFSLSPLLVPLLRVRFPSFLHPLLLRLDGKQKFFGRSDPLTQYAKEGRQTDRQERGTRQNRPKGQGNSRPPPAPPSIEPPPPSPLNPSRYMAVYTQNEAARPCRLLLSLALTSLVLLVARLPVHPTTRHFPLCLFVVTARAPARMDRRSYICKIYK